MLSNFCDFLTRVQDNVVPMRIDIIIGDSNKPTGGKDYYYYTHVLKELCCFSKVT